MSYPKVLLAVDDSDMEKKAVEYVVALSKKNDAEKVVMVHVTPLNTDEKPIWPGEYWEKSPPLQDAGPEVISSVKPRLDLAESIFKKASINYEVRFYVGNPAEVICLLVEKESFDLVVMGSRGLSRLVGAKMESVSHHVLLNAKCPVVIISEQVA